MTPRPSTRARATAGTTTRRATEADPLSPIVATDLGRHLYYARRYAPAIEQLRAAIDLEARHQLGILGRNPHGAPAGVAMVARAGLGAESVIGLDKDRLVAVEGE